MRWERGSVDATTARSASRYDYAVPITIELPRGLFRGTDRVNALLVELSTGGAALLAPTDERLRVKRRYRVHVDDHSGIIEVRNLTMLPDDHVRIGVKFSRLGLELQELISDSLDTARFETSRLT